MSLSAGVKFAGYTIVRLLGSGGMGEVYLAQHPRLPRRDALKILRPDVSGDEDFRQRFIREADLAAALSHPNIVTVYDRGEFDGQLWIATEYIDGADAAQLVRDQSSSGMRAEEASSIVTAIASALDYAHQSGLLHRDVKPANILCARQRVVGGGERIALADFGIAREINDSAGLTSTNLTLGTVAYAAPEQLMGAAIDGRADQYALAVTAFHLLTGVLPFQNSNPVAVISQHLTATPPRLGDYRPELSGFDDVFATALAKDPAQRYPNCTEFARDFARRVTGAPAVHAAATQAAITNSAAASAPTQAAAIPTYQPSFPPPMQERPRVELVPGSSQRTRRRGLWVAGGTAAVVLVAVSFWALPRVAGDQHKVGIPAAQNPSSAPSANEPAAENANVPALYFNAGRLLAGTADPQFPDGEPGKVSVVQIAPLADKYGSAMLPFAFRNNTSEGISHVDWAATARSGGSIVATGNSQGTIPAQVQPGEIGLAFIYFGGESQLPPADTKYEFTVNTMPADQSSYNTAPLAVTEANVSGGAIVGAAVNGTGESVAGPFSVSVYCFDGDELLSRTGDFAKQPGPLPADGQATFSANLYGATCPQFTVGVAGFFEK
jgi:serine/threonine-protein kinase